MAKKRSKTRAKAPKAEARIESKVFAGGAAALAIVGLWYFASGGTVDSLVEDLGVLEMAQPVIPVDLNFPTYVAVDYEFPTYVEVGAHFAISEVEEVVEAIVVEEVVVEEVVEEVVVEEVVDVETELN